MQCPQIIQKCDIIYTVKPIFLFFWAAILFFGCTGKDKAVSSATTISWAFWGGTARIERSKEAAEIFQNQNPDINISLDVSGGTGEHFTKLNILLAGGRGPDIIQMGGNLTDYARNDSLLSFDDFTDDLLDISGIDQSILDMGTVYGQLYGISTGITMPALIYNKSMTERLGAPLPKNTMTPNEFKEYLITLKGFLPRNVYPMHDIGSLLHNSAPFSYWLRYNGTPLFNERTGSSAVTPAIAKTYLDLYMDYRNNSLILPPYIAANFSESTPDTSAIIQGRVIISFCWTNQFSGLQAATNDELALIELPGSVSTKAMWLASSQFYTVNKDSLQPQTAVKFINFLINNPGAVNALGFDRGAPISIIGGNNEHLDPANKKVLDFIHEAIPNSSRETANLPNDTEFNSSFYLIYQQAALGSITTEQGGRQIYELIQRLLRK